MAKLIPILIAGVISGCGCGGDGDPGGGDAGAGAVGDAGAGADAREPTEAEPAPGDLTIVVTSVDELLAALAVASRSPT